MITQEVLVAILRKEPVQFKNMLGDWVTSKFTQDSELIPIKLLDREWRIAPKMVKQTIEFWINVYNNQKVGHTYCSESEVKLNAATKGCKQVKVTGEYEVEEV